VSRRSSAIATPFPRCSSGQRPNGRLTDYQGNLIDYQTAVGGQIIQTDTISGFPGFDGTFPFVTVAYAETMLKAGVPVVYRYFAAAHDHRYGTQAWVRGRAADGQNFADISIVYVGQIWGVCLSRGGC
jgi:hypothetical protein